MRTTIPVVVRLSMVLSTLPNKIFRYRCDNNSKRLKSIIISFHRHIPSCALCIARADDVEIKTRDSSAVKETASIKSS